jgi:hypothetical protein
MLKRNGEDCEHPVPNYPGLLTASEHKAYQVAVPLVAVEVQLFNERANILLEIEKQSPQIAEHVTAQVTHDLQSLTVKEMPEAAWQIRKLLFKSPRSEVLLCSRDMGREKQFGVIEKIGPHSPYARIHGDTDLQMTGNNIFVLLQKFVESERAVLQLFRKDIEATVEENLSEKFPGQNHSRVVRAISARCGNQVPAESEKEKPAKSIKIRM